MAKKNSISESSDYVSVRIPRALWERLAAHAETIRPKTSAAACVAEAVEQWLGLPPSGKEGAR